MMRSHSSQRRRRSPAWAYLAPGVTAVLVLALFPLLYTVWIGFTNHASRNLLTQSAARAYLLDQREIDNERAYAMSLHAVPDAGGEGGQGRAWRLRLAPMDGAPGRHLLSTTPIAQQGAAPETVLMAWADDAQQVALTAAAALSPAASLAEVVALRDRLMPLTLVLPDGVRLAYAGPRSFAVMTPLWAAEPEGGLRDVALGKRYTPNLNEGFFEDDQGVRLQPGFKVWVGWRNHARLLGDADVRGPFLGILVWTVAFAGLTVALAAGLGLTLAVALNWEGLRFRTVYRTLLFLPYAVPAFISILVFKGLFNQNFGEINALLDAAFGIKPAWFAEPWLARTMVILVNVWLGFPYFMVLCAGLIKTIPADLYEASAIAGAGPWQNFRRITAPLIIKPLAPLLIAAFAFNFNNFVLISLLTDGRPDYLNTKLPAGTTDLLVSYTYRIAFTDAGQNFGLAAAVSTMIFLLVAVMSLANLRATRAASTAALVVKP